MKEPNENSTTVLNTDQSTTLLNADKGAAVVNCNDNATVVAVYERKKERETTYQSEAELEKSFIEQLQTQGYEYLTLHTEDELRANLRVQMQKLNHYTFSDTEWERFYATLSADKNATKSIEERTRLIQKDNTQTILLDDGTQRNFLIIDKKQVHNNSTQVINQYTPTGGTYKNRYDVTILVNGLPLVHVELKRRGVALEEAFNQIKRYGRDSFWAGDGLFDFIQLFVISNGTTTKYYSNTTRANAISEHAKSNANKTRTSNSYEFTSFWTDAKNDLITDLTDFTATFFARHTLLHILTQYCVFTEQELLLVMRPYQIAATERLLNRIETAHNSKKYGSKDAGGYIWHTTGSGKTLTSFKAAQLASELDYIQKVIFVVDRKDLDYQTIREYDRFEKGAANGNRSTKKLSEQLANPKCRIIITTIQKLSILVSKYKNSPEKPEFFNQEIVIVFDECHRSQFGEMHKAITKTLKKYYLFGFTGTPIMAANVSRSGGLPQTTEDLFGDCLHTYTILDAIRDNNVLRFRTSFVKNTDIRPDIQDEKVKDIDRIAALMAPERIETITQHILDTFHKETRRETGHSFTFKRLQNIEEVLKSDKKGKPADEIRIPVRLEGFNGMFAVESIAMAKKYYEEFKRQMNAADFPANKRIKIATIFSFAPNEDPDDSTPLDEDGESTDGLDPDSRTFLEEAIQDYNQMFGTNYSTESESFQNYYKDISQRMKNREIDLLLVVNMFLTGFDATTLNTLWVDKRLRYHGLLQAFSRTNRILNTCKPYGNIICFRDLEEATNDAISLFGDKDASKTVLIPPFEELFSGTITSKGEKKKGYVDYLDELKKMLKPGERPFGEQAEKDFIILWGTILRFRNLLRNFEEFEQQDPLSERDWQDYQSLYLELYQKYRTIKGGEVEDIVDDLKFEIDLIKSVEYTIDYILHLIQLYHNAHMQDAELRLQIQKALAASPDLLDKIPLVEGFVDSLTPNDSDVAAQWVKYVQEQKVKELGELIEEEKLKPEATKAFVQDAFQRGYVPQTGMALNNILPPMSLFGAQGAQRTEKRIRVVEKLQAFFTKYYTISSADFD